MNLLVLDKIESHVPGLANLIESYRQRHEMSVRAAIINAVLASEVRYLSREEVLYLAWLKADNDKRLRSLDEDLKRRWLEKQRRQRHAMGGTRVHAGRLTGWRAHGWSS